MEEDTIELIDLLRVVWKWKWFIIVFTFVCAIAAGIISFSMPKIYNISMIIGPGTIGTDVNKGGELVYLDTSDNIKSEIEGEAYNSKIIDVLKLNGEKKTVLKFKVFNPKKSRIVKIVTEYKYTERDIGIKVMKQLYEELFKRYQQVIELKRGYFDSRIVLNNKERDKLEIRIRTLRKNIKINAVKKKFLVEELKKVRANTEVILKKRDVLLSNKTDNNGISALLYSNIMQQNMIYTNQLDNQLHSIMTKQEDLKRQIEDLEKEKEKINIKIDIIKLQRGFVKNIKYIQKPQVSTYPIKPKKKSNVMLAFVVGLFLSLFLAFFLEYLQKMKGDPNSMPTNEKRSSFEN